MFTNNMAFFALPPSLPPSLPPLPPSSLPAGTIRTVPTQQSVGPATRSPQGGSSSLLPGTTPLPARHHGRRCRMLRKIIYTVCTLIGNRNGERTSIPQHLRDSNYAQITCEILNMKHIHMYLSQIVVCTTGCTYLCTLSVRRLHLAYVNCYIVYTYVTAGEDTGADSFPPDWQ